MYQRGTGRLRTGRGRVGAPVGTAGVSRAAGEEALLVDEMFSPLIAALLREDGHDALAVADHPVRATASDPHLAQWASQEACRVVRERPRLRRACRRRRSCAATAVHQLAAHWSTPYATGSQHLGRTPTRRGCAEARSEPSLFPHQPTPAPARGAPYCRAAGAAEGGDRRPPGCACPGGSSYKAADGGCCRAPVSVSALVHCACRAGEVY